jgi:hypothetical protein
MILSTIAPRTDCAPRVSFVSACTPVPVCCDARLTSSTSPESAATVQLPDRRAVTVHQTQHFRSCHIGLSSSGAPVFDADARLVAVLDVSSMDPQLSAQALTLPLVVNSARCKQSQTRPADILMVHTRTGRPGIRATSA